MKHLLSSLLLLLLIGCPPTSVTDPPTSVPRGAGIEVVSSQTVLTLPVSGRDGTSFGTRVQRTLVDWLNDNPEAKILHVEIVGYNGFPQEIVLIVEGKLGR